MSTEAILPLSRHLTARLKMRHLVLLKNIQRFGSLTGVAQATGISQPAATKALAELESIFESSLFTRSTKGLQPTALGKLALVRAQHMLQDLDHWACEMDALRAGHAAHLRIGAVPYVSGDLLTRAIEHLYDRHNVTISLRQATTDQLLQALRHHELDCVMGRASAIVGMNDVWHEVLYAQRPALIAHPKLARRMERKKPDWHELSSMKWILPSPATPTGHMVTELFTRAQARPPSPMIETYSLDVIHGMLSKNESIISIVPEDIATDLCRRGGVAIIEWPIDWELPPISLIRRTRDVPLEAEEKFAQILRELCTPETRTNRRVWR